MTTKTALERAGAWRQDYTGPTGAQSVLQVMLGDAGIPTTALWAQVPHYLSGGASPPAIRAVLERLRDLTGFALDLDGLDEQSAAYVNRVEEGLEDRPDVIDVITAIVLGGVSLLGGEGAVWRAVLGAVFLQTIGNGFNLLGTSTQWQYVIKGMILAAAVSLDAWARRRRA